MFPFLCEGIFSLTFIEVENIWQYGLGIRWDQIKKSDGFWFENTRYFFLTYEFLLFSPDVLRSNLKSTKYSLKTFWFKPFISWQVSKLSIEEI